MQNSFFGHHFCFVIYSISVFWDFRETNHSFNATNSLYANYAIKHGDYNTQTNAMQTVQENATNAMQTNKLIVHADYRMFSTGMRLISLNRYINCIIESI